MVVCNPKNKSEINKLTIGIKKATQRLTKPLEDNKAIAAIGVKLGGWGRNLDRIAKKISETTNTLLLIILHQSSIKYKELYIIWLNTFFCAHTNRKIHLP